ncbi:cystinosin-like isoform X2 [Micropterus salmoides]|uniref:cystinosin-like isoform X2 n=1 Tax=Micropterus salmoides TaxID=27706 RepID=UPI0018EA5502|nr:cystinosin-like isoform X2 [Micropterus salmoides]
MSGLVLSKRWLPAHLLLLWMLNNISESRVYFFAPDAVTLEEYSKANITITSSSPINNSAVIHLNVTYSSKWNYSSIITVPDQVLLPLEATSVSFNVTTHDVGQVTTYVLSNNTDLNRCADHRDEEKQTGAQLFIPAAFNQNQLLLPGMCTHTRNLTQDCTLLTMCLLIQKYKITIVK